MKKSNERTHALPRTSRYSCSPMRTSQTMLNRAHPVSARASSPMRSQHGSGYQFGFNPPPQASKDVTRVRDAAEREAYRKTYEANQASERERERERARERQREREIELERERQRQRDAHAEERSWTRIPNHYEYPNQPRPSESLRRTPVHPLLNAKLGNTHVHHRPL